MEVRNRLTLAVAEVADELAKKLIESEQWDAVGDTPAHAPRKRRAKAAVEESSEE